MNNHWRHIRSERIQCSDLDDPWPDHITLMPLTRAQKRKARNANIIRWGAIAASFTFFVAWIVLKH